MIPSITERIDQNLSRVENLIAIYEDNAAQSRIRRRRPHDTDILRAAVVMLHSTLEDFLRSVLQWRLPTSGKEDIEQIPLLGSRQRTAAKFNLGTLIEFRDWKVGDLIDESIRTYLDSWSTFNDASQVIAAINQSGLEADAFQYDELNEMIIRRHNIVHKADSAKSEGVHGIYHVKPISVTKVKSYVESVRNLKTYVLQQLRPVEYCAGSSYAKYCKAVLFLIKNGRATRGDLQDHLKVGRGAMSFVARDLVALGHAVIDGDRKLIRSTCANVAEADDLLRRFSRNHAVYREIRRDPALVKGFSEAEFYKVVGQVCGLVKYNVPGFDYGPKTMLKFFWGAGYISKLGERLKVTEKPLEGPYSIQNGDAFERRRMSMFFGEGPPPKVVDALNEMMIKSIPYQELAIASDKNCFQTLYKFGLIGVDGRPCLPQSRAKWSAEKLVRTAALENSVVEYVTKIMNDDPTLKGEKIGNLVAQEFDRDWSESSKRRNGNALGRWAVWLHDANKATDGVRQSPREIANSLKILTPEKFGTLLPTSRFSAHNKIVRHGRHPAMPEEFVEAALILRTENKMSQTEIAKRVGVSRATIHRELKMKGCLLSNGNGSS